MNTSKCSNPNCNNHSFEISNETIKDTDIFFQFVRCDKCKTVISIMDTKTVMDRIEVLNNKLDELLNLYSANN